jgi:hypothetical protein
MYYPCVCLDALRKATIYLRIAGVRAGFETSRRRSRIAALSTLDAVCAAQL